MICNHFTRIQRYSIFSTIREDSFCQGQNSEGKLVAYQLCLGPWCGSFFGTRILLFLLSAWGRYFAEACGGRRSQVAVRRPASCKVEAQSRWVDGYMIGSVGCSIPLQKKWLLPSYSNRWRLSLVTRRWITSWSCWRQELSAVGCTISVNDVF